MDKHLKLLIKLLEWNRCKMEKKGTVLYYWDNEYDRNSLIKYNIYNRLRYKRYK